jgi:hypothetical protein
VGEMRPANLLVGGVLVNTAVERKEGLEDICVVRLEKYCFLYEEF